MPVRSVSIAALALIAAAPAPRVAPAPLASSLLTDARTAAHAAGLARLAALGASGHEAVGGSEGAWSLSVDLRRPRFARHTAFPVYSVGEVFDGTTPWRIDRSGGVHPLDGAFAVRDAVTDLWLDRFAYLRKDAGGATFGAVETRTRDRGRYDMVTATPAGGNPVELWFDATTHLLAYTVRRGPISTITAHFEDYRPALGLMLPHKRTEIDDLGGNVDVFTIDAWRPLAPDAATFARPHTPHDTELAGSTTVPVEQGNFLTVSTMLNGKGPFDFILDTGGHNIITPEVAHALGLAVSGSEKSGGAGSGTLTQGDTRIARMTIGAATLHDQHFYVIPEQYGVVERGTRPPLAGILGLELFERLVTTIDYRAGRMTFTLPGAGARCEGTALPIRFNDDMPLVDGTIQGVPGIVAIDSGNGGSTVVQGVWANRTGVAAGMKKGIELVSFGSGGASTNWLIHGGRMALGPIALQDVDLRLAEDKHGSFSSITEAANAGAQVLGRFRVTFDYPGGRMCLAPVPGYVTPPLNRAGLIFAKTDLETMQVFSVIQGSPAAAAGIQRGDLVRTIDGRPVSELSGYQARQIFQRAPGTKVPITLDRKGQAIALTLELQEPR